MRKRCCIASIALFITLFPLISALFAQSAGTTIQDSLVSVFSAQSNMPGILWNKTYGGVLSDYAYSIAQTPDNGFILAGSTYSFGNGSSDFWLVKTDASGNMQWSKNYGDIGNDEAHAIAMAHDGGYVVLGTTNSFGAGSADFWLVKTDQSGDILWNRTYGGVGDDDAWSIEVTADGDLILAGWTTSFGGADFWLVKTDQSGNVLWNKTYGGPLLEILSSVQIVSDGGYVLIGSAYSSDGDSDFWLVKTDSSGNEEWNQTYGGASNDFGFSIVETFDNGFAVAGSTSSYGSGIYDFWLIRTDQSGNPLWNKTYGGLGYDEAWSIMQTTNRGLVLTGWTESVGIGSSDCWLVATDPIGKVQLNVTFGGADCDYSYFALQSIDGNFTVAGETRSFGEGDSDFLLFKVLARIPGDLNGDGIVDIFDITTVALAFSATPSDPNWDSTADTNNDNIVDIFDIVAVAVHFGEIGP